MLFGVRVELALERSIVSVERSRRCRAYGCDMLFAVGAKRPKSKSFILVHFFYHSS